MFGKGKRSPSSSPGLTLHSTHIARRRSPFGMVRALEKASDGEINRLFRWKPGYGRLPSFRSQVNSTHVEPAHPLRRVALRAHGTEKLDVAESTRNGVKMQIGRSERPSRAWRRRKNQRGACNRALDVMVATRPVVRVP